MIPSSRGTSLFCSSSALYKIENKEISEIKISKPNDFTGTVNSYKCIYHRIKNNFLIGILGSNFMFYFDSKTETITSSKKVEGHLNDIGYYMEGNTLLISTLSNIDNKEFYLRDYVHYGPKK